MSEESPDAERRRPPTQLHSSDQSATVAWV